MNGAAETVIPSLSLGCTFELYSRQCYNRVKTWSIIGPPVKAIIYTTPYPKSINPISLGIVSFEDVSWLWWITYQMCFILSAICPGQIWNKHLQNKHNPVTSVTAGYNDVIRLRHHPHNICRSTSGIFTVIQEKTLTHTYMVLVVPRKARHALRPTLVRMRSTDGEPHFWLKRSSSDCESI